MADYSRTIKTPGEVNLLRADLEAGGKLIDISSMIGEISIFEDIFSNTLSGHLIIEDSLDLINELPIIGQELFHIEFHTPTLTKKIAKTFYIYKLQNIVYNKRSVIYTLNFCSTEMIISMNTKISKSYSGNISDTVKDIFKDNRYLNSESSINIERTENSYSFIVPYWTPFKTINWLTNKSLNKSGVSNFMFYETSESFNYKSIDSLVSKSTVRDYVYSDVNANTTTEDIEQKFNIVQKIDMPVTFDYMRNISAGMYGSTLNTFDLTSKQIRTNTYSYIDDFNKNNHTNSVPLKTQQLLYKKIADIHFLTKNDYITGSFKKQNYDKTFLQRGSLLEQINSFKFTINVFGRSDINAGNMINFTMPRYTEITEKEIETKNVSKYFSGKYMITAIHHRIINGTHTMEMEIVSDSFIKR